MQCDYFDAGECASCTLIGTPYSRQVSDLEARIRSVLAPSIGESGWLPTACGPESGFRNRAKLAVGGRRGHLTFGILDGDRQGVDLRGCGLYEAGLSRAIRLLCPVIEDLGLTPYDVPTRSGELKNVILTYAPSGDVMVRFVLRSPGQLRKVREGLPRLQAAVPRLRVVSVNLHPEHKAVLSGQEEIILTDQESLEMPVGDISLRLRPESFFQTNTAMAERLYAQATDWVAGIGLRGGRAPRVWDLYCGVGGFGLTIGAAAPAHVVGLEIEPGAIVGARQVAREIEQRVPLSSFDFRAADAAEALAKERTPDLVVVNPPRRGIGALADALNGSGADHLIYSSCNVESLSHDLGRMTAYTAVAARVFDMFPQTDHHEVLVHLQRA